MMKKTFVLLLTASLAACFLAAPPRAAGGGYEEGLEKLLPPSGGIEGWAIDGERLIYYADDLW
ncbi:MAG TPA: hypothetical protein ENO08_05405, partial [Candidatus Eisenbacteria bacterium]|nr:hypothetical protein [Candidatus Eisenbacteria bacterium]